MLPCLRYAHRLTQVHLAVSRVVNRGMSSESNGNLVLPRDAGGLEGTDLSLLFRVVLYLVCVRVACSRKGRKDVFAPAQIASCGQPDQELASGRREERQKAIRGRLKRVVWLLAGVWLTVWRPSPARYTMLPVLDFSQKQQR